MRDIYWMIVGAVALIALAVFVILKMIGMI